MKNILFIVVLVMTFSISSHAACGDNFDYDTFKAKKIAYITTAINLTPSEAEKFWPIYNEFEQKKFTINKERHEIQKTIKEKADALTDQECIDMTRKMAAFEKSEGELNLEYNEQFLKVLSPKKVAKLLVAEMEFKGHLLREYRNENKEKDK